MARRRRRRELLKKAYQNDLFRKKIAKTALIFLEKRSQKYTFIAKDKKFF